MTNNTIIIRIMLIAATLLLSSGCSIDIDRSETSGAEGQENNSDDLLPKQENRQPDKDYIDETYLELSIVDEGEAGLNVAEFAGYKVQVRLHEIRCLQKLSAYKNREAGWSPPNDECLVFARSVFQGDEDYLKFKAAPYGVYFLDLRIFDAENKLVANGSDNVVIVRDALNETRIVVIPKQVEG